MSDEPNRDDLEEMALAPGWEREHAADYADYHRAIKRKLLREIGLPLS